MPFPAMGIKARLNVILLSTFGLALILDFAFLVPAVFSTIRHNAEERQLSLVSGIAETMEAEFQRARKETEKLALLPEFTSLEKARMDATIRVANAANAFFDYFFVTDAEGRWLSYPTQPQLLGKAILPENMAWVRATIEGNQSYILDAHKSQIGSYVTGVASPIRGPEGNPVGLVRGVISLSEGDILFSLIKGVGAGTGSHCVLMDRGGAILASSRGLSDSTREAEAAFPSLELLRAASRGSRKSFVVEDEGQKWLATLASVPSADWTVAIGQPLGMVLTNAWKLAFGSAALFLAAILLSLMAIRFPIGRSLSSLETLLGAMRRGIAPYPGSIKGGDEVAGLAREIGQLYAALAESKRHALESEARVARLKRFEDLGILAAGIAHNFRNILQGIGASAELCQPELTGTEEGRSARLRDIGSMVAQGSALATSLMRLGKGQASGRSIIDLKLLVSDLSDMFAHSHPGLRLAFSAPPEAIMVEADQGALHQVFLNLLLNAAQAMEEHGEVGVELSRTVRPEGLGSAARDGEPWIQVSIKDSGPGIEAELINRIFEPFFTRKAGGTGLGLSSAFRIVQDHGGLLTCASEPGRGATFSVCLPLKEAGAVQASA